MNMLIKINKSLLKPAYIIFKLRLWFATGLNAVYSKYCLQYYGNLYCLRNTFMLAYDFGQNQQQHRLKSQQFGMWPQSDAPNKHSNEAKRERERTLWIWPEYLSTCTSMYGICVCAGVFVCMFNGGKCQNSQLTQRHVRRTLKYLLLYHVGSWRRGGGAFAIWIHVPHI